MLLTAMVSTKHRRQKMNDQKKKMMQFHNAPILNDNKYCHLNVKNGTQWDIRITNMNSNSKHKREHQQRLLPCLFICIWWYSSYQMNWKCKITNYIFNSLALLYQRSLSTMYCPHNTFHKRNVLKGLSNHH